ADLLQDQLSPVRNQGRGTNQPVDDALREKSVPLKRGPACDTVTSQAKQWKMRRHPSCGCPMTTPIQTFLNDLHFLDVDRATLVEAVRAKVGEKVPSATEAMKYGGILFSAGVVFCGVFAYRNHVSVEFAKGAHIADPHGFLE